MFRQSAVLYVRTENVNKVYGMENRDREKNFRSLQQLNEYWYDVERTNIIFGYTRMPEVEGSICEADVLNCVTLCQCILNYVGVLEECSKCFPPPEDIKIKFY